MGPICRSLQPSDRGLPPTDGSGRRRLPRPPADGGLLAVRPNDRAWGQGHQCRGAIGQVPGWRRSLRTSRRLDVAAERMGAATAVPRLRIRDSAAVRAEFGGARRVPLGSGVSPAELPTVGSSLLAESTDRLANRGPRHGQNVSDPPVRLVTPFPTNHRRFRG